MSAEGAAPELLIVPPFGPHFQTSFNPELTLGAIFCRPFGPETKISQAFALCIIELS
jgi:hypothetical protein